LTWVDGPGRFEAKAVGSMSSTAVAVELQQLHNTEVTAQSYPHDMSLCVSRPSLRPAKRNPRKPDLPRRRRARNGEEGLGLCQSLLRVGRTYGKTTSKFENLIECVGPLCTSNDVSGFGPCFGLKPKSRQRAIAFNTSWIGTRFEFASKLDKLGTTI
jgi:hypothetical protein